MGPAAQPSWPSSSTGSVRAAAGRPVASRESAVSAAVGRAASEVWRRSCSIEQGRGLRLTDGRAGSTPATCRRILGLLDEAAAVRRCGTPSRGSLRLGAVATAGRVPAPRTARLVPPALPRGRRSTLSRWLVRDRAVHDLLADHELDLVHRLDGRRRARRWSPGRPAPTPCSWSAAPDRCGPILGATPWLLRETGLRHPRHDAGAADGTRSAPADADRVGSHGAVLAAARCTGLGRHAGASPDAVAPAPRRPALLIDACRSAAYAAELGRGTSSTTALPEPRPRCCSSTTSPTPISSGTALSNPYAGRVRCTSPRLRENGSTRRG